jgi:hypothetical protein
MARVKSLILKGIIMTFKVKDHVQIFNNINRLYKKRSDEYEAILKQLDFYNMCKIRMIEWNGQNYNVYEQGHSFWYDKGREVKEVFLSELEDTGEPCVIVVRF